MSVNVCAYVRVCAYIYVCMLYKYTQIQIALPPFIARTIGWQLPGNHIRTGK